MEITPKKIVKALKSYDVSPSQEWSEHVLLSIRSLEDNTSLLFFNQFFMKKLFAGILAVLVVVVASAYIYTSNTPYAKAMKHLKNASIALEQLKNPEADSAVGFLSVAYADVTVEDETVDLINEVVSETDEAVNEADAIEDSDDLDEVLNAVDDVQDDTVAVLSDVIEESDDETVLEAVADAINETNASNEVIEEALSVSEEDDNDALDDDLTAKVNTKRQEKQAQRLTVAKEAMTALEPEYATMTDSMKKKYDTINQILADCEASDDADAIKCNSGKAAGLANALSVKARNEARQEEDVDNNEDGDNDEDAEVENSADKSSKEDKKLEEQSRREENRGQEKKQTKQ